MITTPISDASMEISGPIIGLKVVPYHVARDLELELIGLKETAQAVVDRWDKPQWKDMPSTAVYINKLRAGLSWWSTTA